MRLEDFAALGSTGSRIACFSKALTLAGILTFAGVARAIAAALALASIGATKWTVSAWVAVASVPAAKTAAAPLNLRPPITFRA
jgi:hypothetical protein